MTEMRFKFGFFSFFFTSFLSLFFFFFFFFVFILQANVLIIESWEVGLMNTMTEGKNRISRGDQVSI